MGDAKINAGECVIISLKRQRQETNYDDNQQILPLKQAIKSKVCVRFYTELRINKLMFSTIWRTFSLC